MKIKLRTERWDYPRGIDEGLEKEKKWYEFQKVEDTTRYISEEEYVNLIIQYTCYHYNSLTQLTENTEVLDMGDTILTFTTEGE